MFIYVHAASTDANTRCDRVTSGERTGRFDTIVNTAIAPTSVFNDGWKSNRKECIWFTASSNSGWWRSSWYMLKKPLSKELAASWLTIVTVAINHLLLSLSYVDYSFNLLGSDSSNSEYLALRRLGWTVFKSKLWSIYFCVV